MISDFRFYFKLLIRRLPVMIVLFLIASIAGVVVSQRLPTLYQTQATLLVESAQISDNLVRSTVQVDASEQLEVIQQRLLTRANLLDIARDIKVFPDLRTMTPDQIVGRMRNSTSVRRSSGRNKATLMTIGFEGGDPEKAAAVVNRYVTIVLSTNSDFRTSAAEGTLDFFEQEVTTLSQNLDVQSAKIVEFKTQNADALPENLDYRLGRQSLLQERLARAGRDIESLAAQRTSIERIYETTGTLTSTTPAGPPQSVEERELRALEVQLRTALSVYSEQNPKVVNLRNRIDGLRTALQVAAPVAPTSDDEDAQVPTAQASALQVSLTEIDSRMETLRREVTDVTAELEQLSDSIKRTPVNSITLAAMERDLKNIQNLYSAGVNQLAQARMGERIELSSKGERITVLEAASVPTTPSSPNRPAIASLGVGVGLGLAGAVFFVLELLNQAIRRPADIVKAMEITPLATVPRIESAAHRRWRRVTQIVLLMMVLAGVPALLWAIDTYYLPLDLLFEKIKDRLI